MRTASIYISLNESFRELYIAAREYLPKWDGYWDGSPVIHAILDEIFRTEGVELQRRSSMRCPSAIDVLKGKGFDDEDARLVAMDLYRNVLSQINAYLPPVTYTELRQFQYGMFDEVDLMISFPPLYEEAA